MSTRFGLPKKKRIAHPSRRPRRSRRSTRTTATATGFRIVSIAARPRRRRSNGIADDDGCAEPDADGDQIVGIADKCPSKAEDVDQFEDDDGCPEPDNDGDGLDDVARRCPGVPEMRDGFDDDDGCPDSMPAEVDEDARRRAVTFEANRARVTDKAKTALVRGARELPTHKIVDGDRRTRAAAGARTSRAAAPMP